MVVVVCVAALTDLVSNVAVGKPPFGDGVGFDFEGGSPAGGVGVVYFTELGSIAENGAAMGGTSA